jgi:formate hydrogenlyase subunit 3/multisubunit Na+/H+ antiporter MnhD subunit
LRVNGQEFTYLSDLRFISASRSHWDRLLLVFALASMAGLPPFAGFYGKMLIWSSLIEDIYLFNDVTSYALLLVNLAVSLIVIFYYMRLIVIVYLGGGENSRVTPYLLGFWQASKNSDWTVYRHDVVANAAGSVDYVYARVTDVRGIQYVLAFLLAFWTLVMPATLTLTTTVSETLALTWTN